MFKSKKKKPKRAKFNYGDLLMFNNVLSTNASSGNSFMLVIYIKRYGKGTFMYSENGWFWVNEYRLTDLTDVVLPF